MRTANRRLLIYLCLFIEFIQVKFVKPPCLEIEFFCLKLSGSFGSIPISSSIFKYFVCLLTANFDIFPSEKLDLICKFSETSAAKLAYFLLRTPQIAILATYTVHG
jgi:hypothetical protein